MGIRHLTTFLRPFVKRESLDGKSVTIDGPAFAHHIYNISLSRRQQARNGLEAVPTYTELGQAAIAWLDELQTSDVVVRNIYFDGFLPPHKLDTRLQRLVAYTAQLTSYHESHPRPCLAPIPPSDPPNWLFNHLAIPPRVNTVPPLSFLVPAIFEALVHSEYAQVIDVVPEEADYACARHARNLGGVVLTSDSDLLVHDIGVSSAVCFFSDVQKSLDAAGGDVNGLMYHPVSLSDRLSLPREHGLKSLAFEIVLDPTGSFQKLLAQAKSLKSVRDYPDSYANFLVEYLDPSLDRPGNDEASRPGPVRAGYPSACLSPETTLKRSYSCFSKLDPRTSEYVLQCLRVAYDAGKRPAIDHGLVCQNRVFLPPLVECPLHVTGWEVSTGTRQLAYGLLNLILLPEDRHFVVVEHRKQQAIPGGRELQLPTPIQITDACNSLRDTYIALREKLPHLSNTYTWTALAVLQEMEWSMSRGRQSLSELAVQQFADFEGALKTEVLYGWDMIQFFSQVQASLYSWRILGQIASVVLSFQAAFQIPDCLDLLFKKLQHLPKLSEYQDRGHHDLFSAELASMVRAAQALMKDQDVSPDTNERTEVRTIIKREKKQRKVKGRSSATKRQRTSNPFDVLNVNSSDVNEIEDIPQDRN